MSLPKYINIVLKFWQLTYIPTFAVQLTGQMLMMLHDIHSFYLFNMFKNSSRIIWEYLYLHLALGKKVTTGNLMMDSNVQGRWSLSFWLKCKNKTKYFLCCWEMRAKVCSTGVQKVRHMTFINQMYLFIFILFGFVPPSLKADALGHRF